MFKYTNIYKTTSMFLTGKNKMCFFDSEENHFNNLINVVTLSSCQSMCYDDRNGNKRTICYQTNTADVRRDAYCCIVP